jgi:hypothetical protein
MFVAGACLAWAAPSACAAIATPQGTVELTLPRAAAADEAVWLQVRAGALPRGTEIQVSTGDGVLLGTVSPFGTPRGQSATYTIPLPKTAVRDGRVRLRFEVHEVGAPARPPRPGEVENVSLIYVPISNAPISN